MHSLVVEEKVDGANVGISIGDDKEIRVQNRGSYLSADMAALQFKPLFRWLIPREELLIQHLRHGLILFGEWCYAVHSVHYSALPDWFLAFDVYDRSTESFWPVDRRDELVRNLGLPLVPRFSRGRFSLKSLLPLLGRSDLGATRGEGLYLRVDDDSRSFQRAKLVSAEFTQAIDEHWSHRAMQTNLLAEGVAWR